MGNQSKRHWDGGYIRTQKNGRDIFIIEREVGGRRFHISTRRGTWKSALKELERFELDPAGYSPLPEDGPKPLFLTDALCIEFGQWQVDSGCTTKHANSCKNRLAAWIEDLAGIDLRKVSLRDHIKPALEGRGTQRAHRISTLKAFYAWLRKERHLLVSAEDPTLDLPVPQSRPEKYRRRKAVPFESVQAVVPHLDGPYRDILVLMAATGWHVTEMERFVRQDASEIVPADRDGTLAVLVTKHKGGEMTRTPLNNPSALEAAQRLKARGSVPKRPNAALKAACAKARVTQFTFGVLRHSVATWSIEAGAIPAQVSEFLNHKDPRTAKRFYIDVHVPTVQVPLPRLKLVKG